MTDPPKRHLNWAACFNARDVGGYPTSGASGTRWGALVRADTLGRLTPEGRQSLVDYGVKTIVDLRSPRELEIDPNPFSDGAAAAYRVCCLNLPLIDPADPDARAALDASGSQAENYCLLLDLFSARVAGIVRAVAQAEPGGVLVHCHAGKDRTGVLVAVLLALAGVSREVIARDYALSEPQLQPLFDQLYPTIEDPLDKQRVREWARARPATMLAVLEHLDRRYGGVEPYLGAASLTAGEIARVRERLGEPAS